jgi:multicomponent Na+:H+ antiporter subunit A
MTLLAITLVPMAAAGLLLPLGRLLRARTGWVAAAVSATLFVYFATWLPTISAGAVARAEMAWAPALGVSLSLYLDGLSLFFALLVTGIGTLIFLYGIFYLAHREDHPRFFAGMLLFMGSMLGAVLSANLIALFVFWELTSLSSFFLIGFWHEREASRYGATKALIITALGGLAMLLGFILLYLATGTWDLTALLGRGPEVRAHPWYPAILALVYLGCATKSAQTPFHIWLPNAMEAPTPVSAYLHSATMVQAGLYLAARLYPVLGGTELWASLAGGIGMLTLIVGGLLALRQDDLKALLAYSTVSQLGLVMAMFGLGTAAGVEAGTFHLMTHAIFKAALFLVVGIVEHETHSRRLSELGGLYRALPITGTCALLASLASAGFPPFGAFISKEMAFAATLEGAVGWLGTPGLLPAAMVIGSAFTFAYSIRLLHEVFFRPAPAPRPPHVAAHPHEATPWLWVPPGILGVKGLALGLFPGMAEAWAVAPMASAIAGRPLHPDLTLWHGLGWPLALSCVTIVLGLALYRVRAPFAAWRRGQRGPGPDAAYDAGLALLDRLAAAWSGWLQSGDLRRYISVVTWAVVAAALGPLVLGAARLGPLETRPLLSYEGTILFLIAAAAAALIFLRNRLAAIIVLGAVGYLVGILFIILQAPDLALTQILIETVSLALFLLVLHRLPPYAPEGPGWARVARDLLVSLAAGVAVVAVLLLTMGRSARESIAHYFLDQSLPAAGGRNVVNVILIDFRGYDTLGEISVLAIGLLGVYALIVLGRRP